MKHTDSTPRPEAEMRRVLRALVPLSALPLLWQRLDEEAIAESLVLALVKLFDADIVYVFVTSHSRIVELACGPQGRVPAALIPAIRTSLRSLSLRRPHLIQSVLSGDPVTVFAPFMKAEGDALLVLASKRPDYPTAIDKRILQIAASELTVAMKRAEHLALPSHLSTLIDLSSAFIGIADLQGRPLFVNPAGLRLVGMTSVQAIRDLNVVDFLEFGDRDRARYEVWPDTLSKGRWLGHLAFLNARTGAVIPLLVECFRIDTAKGDPIAVGTICVDARAWSQPEGTPNDPPLAANSRQSTLALARIESLSEREGQVLLALAGGCPHKEIAFRLGISVRTIEVHRARMMRRLGVRTLAEAIRIAVISGAVQ